MRTAAVAVLAFLMLLPALPAQAQVGYHAGVAMDLWDRDAGYEEAYFLGGLSWTPGGWEYRASAAVLVRQSAIFPQTMTGIFHICLCTPSLKLIPDAMFSFVPTMNHCWG